MMRKIVVYVSAVTGLLSVISAVLYCNRAWIILRLLELDRTLIIRGTETVSLVPLKNREDSEVGISCMSADRLVVRSMMLKEFPRDLRVKIENWLLSEHKDAYPSISDYVPDCRIAISNLKENSDLLITVNGGMIFTYDIGGTNQYVRIGSSIDRKIVDEIRVVVGALGDIPEGSRE